MTQKQQFANSSSADNKVWIEIVRRYNKPNKGKSIWQIINSLGSFLLIWYLMYRSLDISYWITLGLAIPAAGFTVRMFIIMHDCGHGSFFKSRVANKITGTILGCLAFTPFDKWTNDHAIHHKTVGNLDQRGVGDLWTMTVEEYKSLTPGKKIRYRVYRNPILLFGLSSFLLFVVLFRFALPSPKKSELGGVIITNIIIIAMITGISLLVGFKSFVLIQLPITYLATSAGVWLFYLQHQYDDVLWTRHDDWDFKTIAMEGSSYLKFPRFFHWFSGNIGFHHIHHLSPKIPNYKLEKCHKENSMFDQVKPITFLQSLRTMRLRLWDEAQNRLISFRDLKKMPASV
jgi:omega-6 fatty acid desaturase (delta-12 desaturase)